MKEKIDTVIDIPALKELARELRLDILESTTRAGSGHPSSSWSAVEILTALYFGGILRYRSDEPLWPDRDRFIMSKGHAAPLLYAVLAHAGYFPHEMIMQLREVNSPVQGHPILGKMPAWKLPLVRWDKGFRLAWGISWGVVSIIVNIAFMSCLVMANAKPGRFGNQPCPPRISNAIS